MEIERKQLSFNDIYQQMIVEDILLCVVIIRGYQERQSQEITTFLNQEIMTRISSNEMKCIILTERDDRLIYHRLKNGNVILNSIEIYDSVILSRLSRLRQM